MLTKNVHITHLEDLVFNQGSIGAHKAINFLRDVRNVLYGRVNNKINIGVKWDGAPSIFAGIDPTDGKFFVATKSVFNKNPKIYKTYKEIDADIDSRLAFKLKLALYEFKKLGIKEGVYQGDLMFLKEDLKIEIIDSIKYITFHPNTIVYAIDYESELAEIIKNASIGVIWHTLYTGETFESMKCSFDCDIKNNMISVPTVWMNDANYKCYNNIDIENEYYDYLTTILNKSITLLQSINNNALNLINKDKLLLSLISSHSNKKVKNNDNKHIDIEEFIYHVDEHFQKEIDKKIKLSSKIKWENDRKIILKFITDNYIEMKKVFELVYMITYLKRQFICSLNENILTKTFIKTNDGFLPTSIEGYVISDKLSNHAVKLIDRIEFSKHNFSTNTIKGWVK